MNSMSILLVVLLFGLSEWVYAAELPAVHVVEEGGFVDVDLPIERVVQDQGVVRVIARGRIDGGNVGLEVDFPLKGKDARANGIRLSFGTARLRSLGVDSDRLVNLLSKKYRVPTDSKAMLQSIDAAAAGLGGDVTSNLKGKKDMKFFFYADGPDDRYAELYINVDFDRRFLEIHEKDPGYRKGVILALTKGL